MHELHYRRHTSIDEVLTWDFTSATDVHVSRDAGFEIGAEGIAIARLRQVAQSPRAYAVHCQFQEPDSLEGFLATALASAFGVALARAAREVEFSRNSPTGLQSVQAYSTSVFRNLGGRLQGENYAALIASDPRFPIPLALALRGGPQAEHPTPSVFNKVLRSAVDAMKIVSSHVHSQLPYLSDFAYELFRNTHDHAKPHYSDFRAGTRAVTLERYATGGRPLQERALGADTREYLYRAITGAVENDVALLCLTVADQGDGIQGTLPARRDESRKDVLLRAFKEGESRKPVSELQRGLGLPRVLQIAHQLSGMLRVYSSGIVATADFTVEGNVYPTLDAFSIKEVDPFARHGTSVSLMFRETLSQSDQEDLFSRSFRRRHIVGTASGR